jgi:hypothetical protein
MIVQGVALTGTTVADSYITTQNLAIWIDANNGSSYAGTGTAITDLSGNGRTQNLQTAAQFTTLSGVKCWDCSNASINNAISAAAIGPVLPISGFTYIAWARVIASTATFRTLFRTSPDDHPILINAGTNNLGMWNNPTATFYPAGYSVAGLANIWAQWAVTGDSTGQTFYINGQVVGTVSGQTSAGNSHNITGNVGANGGQPFGYIANMFLYTTKLTQLQIQQNWGASKGVFGL